MEYTGAEAYTVLGWTWLGFILKSQNDEGDWEPLQGFELWRYVARQIHVEERDFKNTAYNQFKNALKELESLGAITRCGPPGERKLARVLWLPTEHGREWWQGPGLDEHGPDRNEDKRSGVAKTPPMKKWMDVRTANGPTRRLIQQKIFSGEWQVAFRPNDTAE